MTFQKKLHTQRGETMVEALVSILVVGLISAGLAAMIAAASRINQTLKGEDQELYQSVTAMETASGAGTPGTVTVTIQEKNGSRKTIVNLTPSFYDDARGAEGQERRLMGYYLERQKASGIPEAPAEGVGP